MRKMFGEDKVKAALREPLSRPLANEKGNNFLFVPGLSDISGATPQTSNSPVNYQELWNMWVVSPESIAACSTIVTDVLSDGYTIKPIKAGDKTAVTRATEFLEANQFKTRVLPSMLYDQLVTGDAYIYKPKLTEPQVRDAVKAIARRLPLKSNKAKMQEYIYYAIRDEDIYRTKDLINIASSTVTIKHDIYGSVGEYVQKVGQNTSVFSPAELIHFKYMHLNGKVYSFCPLKAILSELEIIANIKDNAGMMFDNGGQPSYVFNLPKETPKSDNTISLGEQLKAFKENINAHRNLIATGELNIERLESQSAAMQYRELLEQVTNIVYMIWGVPPSKLGRTTESSGAYDSGLATEGYYRRIAQLQDMNYSQFNAQLMIPEFKVQLIPNKTYLQDELKETQMVKQKFDIAQQAWNNNWVNDSWVREYLMIEDDYVGTFEKPMEQNSVFKQGDMKKGDVEGNTAKQEINKMKSETQKAKTSKVKALTDYELEAIKQNESLPQWKK